MFAPEASVSLLNKAGVAVANPSNANVCDAGVGFADRQEGAAGRRDSNASAFVSVFGTNFPEEPNLGGVGGVGSSVATEGWYRT